MTKHASRLGQWMAAVVATSALGLSNLHGASLYLSAVAETFGADSGAISPAPGKPVTYVARDGGFIDSGDPVGGLHSPPAALIESAVTQALADRGFEPAPSGAFPSVLLIYNWGEIRRDSFQVQPTNHLKGNDRARLLLVDRTADAERIERDIVTDRYTQMKMGAMTRTEADREALQLSHDEMAFVVVSAYDAAALREHNRKLVWQVRLTTRAVGQPMADELVSLIHYGATYFGRNESARVDLKKDVIAASSVRIASPVPALNELPTGVDAAFVQGLVQSEHATWSGKFPSD